MIIKKHEKITAEEKEDKVQFAKAKKAETIRQKNGGFKNQISMRATIKKPPEPKIIMKGNPPVEVEVYNFSIQFEGMNYLSVSIYDKDLIKQFKKLKSGDFVEINGLIWNRFYKAKKTSYTYIEAKQMKLLK